MRLRSKIVLLAVVPLLAALALVALAVQQQTTKLAGRERELVERAYLKQRRGELRSFVDLATSTVRPLYDGGRDDEAVRADALCRLAAPDYGSDGYFFVYDLQGRALMHSRQPEPVPGRHRGHEGRPRRQASNAR